MFDNVFETFNFMKIDILRKQDLNENICIEVSKLFEQLAGDMKQIDLIELFEEHNSITFAYCQDNNKIIGIALMCTYTVISGEKGWIEDVVVETEYRGKGLGRKLMNKLLEVAKEKNLSQVLLFSGSHRTAARHLYTELGFQPKNSQLYFLKLR